MQHSELQIAAAFMQMKLGDEIEDIREEKFFFDRKEGRRGAGRQNGRDGRGSDTRRRSGVGSGADRPRDNRSNGRYAALRIKTKKQGTS